MTTSRRGALLGLWSGALLVCGCRVQFVKPPPDAEYRTLALNVARTAQDRSRLRALGMTYFRNHGARLNPAELAEACFPTVEERQRALAMPAPRLLEWLATKARNDYEAGRVESVQGWLLSRTELRFAAIVALIRRL